ncbi:hypothetical protein [Actinomadura fibrosa]|uniref:Uncharacterized protein n=1 Tax=Actinomadura fibrosa TaxID=111802 RepID=A0ABW2XYE9_9ACTN|nr:hypothetical protein [Actinomadura fibrosa]
MGTVRVVFETPQDFDGVRVPELTVDADRLVLVAGGTVVLDVPADNVREVGPPEEAAQVPAAVEPLPELRTPYPNAGRIWTAAEEDELRRLWAAGASEAELVERFGRSPEAIDGAVHRLGLPLFEDGPHQATG